jgi:replicative DNA helicase
VKLPGSHKDVSDLIATFKSKDEAKSVIQDLFSAAFPHINGYHVPLYTLEECEPDYRRLVKQSQENSFSLGKWMPSLSSIRPLVPGEFMVLIGDTGTGKTGILQNISRAARPLPTVMFELELPKEMMFERYVSMLTKMTGEQVEKAYWNAHDSESFVPTINKELKNICVCPLSKLSVEKMEEIIMRAELKLGERPRLVLVDYLQLVSATGPNRREKISDVSEQLKIMAKSTRTIIIAASQISRPTNVDKDWEPNLHSAKESGSIESSCGFLLSAWQDFKEPGVLNMRVLKSSKGGTGTFVKCNFDGARMIITERSKISDTDVPTNHNS